MKSLKGDYKGKLTKEEDTFFDTFKRYMKDPNSLAPLPMCTKRRLVRVIFAKNLMKANPTWTSTEIRKTVAREFRISMTPAFYDVQVAAAAIGFDYNDDKLFWKEYVTRKLVKAIEYEEGKTSPNGMVISKLVRELAEVTGIKESDLNIIRREDYGSKNLILMIKSENHIHYQALDELKDNNPEVIEAVLVDMIDEQEIELPEDEDRSESDIEN
jgi:hypothetical protein